MAVENIRIVGFDRLHAELDNRQRAISANTGQSTGRSIQPTAIWANDIAGWSPDWSYPVLDPAPEMAHRSRG